MRLEAEGLVELEQNRGFKVSEVCRRQARRPDADPNRNRRHRSALVAGKGRRRVGGKPFIELPSPVETDQAQPLASRRHQ